MAQTICILALYFKWWYYPSDIFGPFGTIIVKDTFIYPLLGLTFLALATSKAKVLFFAGTLAIVATLLEMLLINLTTLLRYTENWNYGLTFISYLIAFFLVYLNDRVFRNLLKGQKND